eukprot:TRINITY_DN4158_c0_g1_i2.p1 TRINITY_DN4158_c0_g1~~TRINITY_DN4158_c0_g1_i2.p1  ORF type:complete len:143 (+),score=31.57 TRINITY_DN4158_c0_g1_i2:141-569(+)
MCIRDSSYTVRSEEQRKRLYDFPFLKENIKNDIDQKWSYQIDAERVRLKAKEGFCGIVYPVEGNLHSYFALEDYAFFYVVLPGYESSNFEGEVEKKMNFYQEMDDYDKAFDKKMNVKLQMAKLSYDVKAIDINRDCPFFKPY